MVGSKVARAAEEEGGDGADRHREPHGDRDRCDCCRCPSAAPSRCRRRWRERRGRARCDRRAGSAAPTTSTAATRLSSGMMPTAMPPPSGSETPASSPIGSRRVSAEKASRRPFWMMIDRPKVTSSGGRMSVPSVRFRSKRCRRVADGEHDRHGEREGERTVSRPSAVTSTRIRNAANMMRSPCARLTSRMMPKISDRPVA